MPYERSINITVDSSGSFHYSRPGGGPADPHRMRADHVVCWRLNQSGHFPQFTITFKDDSPFSWQSKTFPGGNAEHCAQPRPKALNGSYRYTVKVEPDGPSDDPEIQIDSGTPDLRIKEKLEELCAGSWFGTALVAAGMVLIGFGVRSLLSRQIQSPKE